MTSASFTEKTTTLLELDKFSVLFKESAFWALKQVSFTIEQGETIAIVGESGSGKSIMALSAIGLQPHTATLSGMLKFNGTPVSNYSPRDWEHIRGGKISMVFQEPMTALNPIKKVGIQLKEAIRQHQNISQQAAKTLTIDWLTKIGIPNPEKAYNKYPHQLSGGQKQRIMIAIAMCNKPQLLIADEPSTALDANIQQEVISLMLTLQKENKCAILFITHDLALATKIADKIIVMKAGEIIEISNTSDIIENPQSSYTKALFNCRPKYDQKDQRLATVDEYLSDTNLASHQQTNHSNTHTTLARVENLNIWYPTHNNLLGKTTEYFKAVNNVSFAIEKGQTLGLVGESGCGKSSIGKALSGLTPIHSGAVTWQNEHVDYTTSKGLQHVRSCIQLIFQDPSASLSPKHTIQQILTEAIVQSKKLKEVKKQYTPSILLNLVGLPNSSLAKYPHQFSGGQKQRIAIARALAMQPTLMICDESVSALDLSIQAQILNLLKDLQIELDLSYLFISHDLVVVHHMSDYIAVMQKGNILEYGESDQIIYQPKHPYTQYLLSNAH